MNWKRGFRRIAIFLAICTAFACSALVVGLIFLLHDEAKSNFEWKQEQYNKRLQEEHLRQLNNLGRAPTFDEIVAGPNLPEGFVLDEPSKLPEGFRLETPQEKAEAEIIELEKGFWVNLSTGGLVIAGLIGWIIGFGVVWFVYKILEWLVLGFCDSKPLEAEAKKT